MLAKFIFVSLLIFVFLGVYVTPVLAYWPADSYYKEQWYLYQIKAQQAWDFTYGSEEIIVAVLDSGVDLDHPDLKENIWVNSGEIAGDGIDNDDNGYIDDMYGWDFWDNDNEPQPDVNLSEINEAGVNHGTIVAGILGARGDNGEGIAGMNWHSRIMPLRILDNEGNGNTTVAVQAIDYAVEKGADIINMSFVGEDYSKNMHEAIKRAWDRGVLIVGSTGNDLLEVGKDLDKAPNYPAGYDGEDNMVIGVTAVDRSDKKANFANYGRSFIDIAAPGVSFFSTLFYDSQNENFNKYYGGYWSGSSVATALVSGAASLIKSLNPSLSNKKIRDVILETADDINRSNPQYSGQLGEGRLNAYKALDATYRGYFNTQPSKDILIGAGRGRKPEVKVFSISGVLENSFLAYGENFRGGVELVACDLNNDNVDEIIVGAGNGGGPHVRVFDKEGNLINHFFAYDERFRGGVNVACGDINKDGKNEIITGAGVGGGPHVRIFDKKGNLINHFFAYSHSFRGGVNVTVRDLNRDGWAEIITGPAGQGGPHVRIFNERGEVISQFFAFSKDFRGGIDVGADDLDNDKRDEIVVTITTSDVPYVRVFDSDLKLKYQFLAYSESFRGGVNMTVADLESDGMGEIIVAPATGNSSEVRIYNIEGKKLSSFSVFNDKIVSGVNVGVVGSD